MAETFLYLTTTGRKSGNPHQIEIWYVEHADCFYLCAERGEQSDWVKNLRRTPQVRFYTAERGQTPPPLHGVASTELDAATRAAVKSLFDAKYGWSDGLLLHACPM